MANLIGTTGNDILDARPYGQSNDYIVGDAGNDLLMGGSGNDILLGDKNNNQITGAGNDTLYGDEGDDGLYGGNGNDFLYGGDGNDFFGLNSGNDYLDGGSGIDTVGYSSAPEGIRVNLSSTTSFGIAGNRAFDGFGGEDTLVGIENINGSQNDDLVIGNDANNSLFGDDGNDTLNGGWGNDILAGGAGNDTLVGGAGNDRLVGDAGQDRLTGGTGADNFIFRSLADVGDIITDFNSSQGDKIEIYRRGFAGSATTSDRFSFDDNVLFFDDQQIATLENVNSFNVNTDIVLVL